MAVIQVIMSVLNPTTLVTMVLGLLVYYALSFYQMTKKLEKWYQQGIKGPNPYFLHWRILQFLLSSKALFMDSEFIKKYGKVHCYNETDRVALVIADAGLLKDVLVRHFSHFMDRRLIFREKYTSKFLTQLCGSEWKHTRSIMTPTFTSGKMKAMLHLMNECLEPMMNRIRKNSGQDMDVKDLFGCFTMDVIAKCAFAVETNTHDNESHPFVVNAKKFFEFPPLRMLMVLFSPEFIRSRLSLSFFDPSAMDYLAGLGHHMIDERRKKGIKAGNRSYNDFLQLMLEAGREPTNHEQEDTDENSNEHRVESNKKTLTDEEIIANIIVILLAGYETTASLLTYASYSLAVHPEIQAKLRQEILEAKNKNNGVLDYDTLMSLPYLDAVINETLRMYPPVIRTDRHCSEDITLDYKGKKIEMKKGDAFILPIYAIHYMEEYFPEPEKFKPSRFLPENKDQLTPYTFLAFVAGPRNCVGMRFALLEAKLTLSNIMLEFDFVRSSQTSVPLDFSATKVTLKPKEVIVKLQTRE